MLFGSFFGYMIKEFSFKTQTYKTMVNELKELGRDCFISMINVDIKLADLQAFYTTNVVTMFSNTVFYK